jgi:hypothetical protein
VSSDSALPIAASVDTTKVPNGAHTLVVAVRYKALGGKLRWQKASVPVTVNNAVTPPPPIKPSIPVGLAAAPGDKQVALRWNANPVAEAVNTYQMYKNDQNLDLNVSGTSYVAVGLANGTSYSFRVGAHNAVGYGDWSAAVVVTPVGAPQPGDIYPSTSLYPSEVKP